MRWPAVLYPSVVAVLLSSFTSIAFGAPAAEGWELWSVSDEASEIEVDHGPWQSLLDQWLVAPHPSGINRVRYAELAPERELLDTYVRDLQAIDPRTLRRAEQFAYWVNLYNAATVQVVLENPGKGTILRMGQGFFSLGPWDDEVLKIAGQPVTLNDIEHRILRPFWRDRRIHYVVNCASLGCPNLASEAFTAANSERLLVAGERSYLNHSRGVQIDGRRLTLSSIFDWYREDFPSGDAELLSYIASVIEEPALAEQVRSHSGRIRHAYDWDLNQPDPEH